MGRAMYAVCYEAGLNYARDGGRSQNVLSTIFYFQNALGCQIKDGALVRLKKRSRAALQTAPENSRMKGCREYNPPGSRNF